MCRACHRDLSVCHRYDTQFISQYNNKSSENDVYMKITKESTAWICKNKDDQLHNEKGYAVNEQYHKEFWLFDWDYDINFIYQEMDDVERAATHVAWQNDSIFLMEANVVADDDFSNKKAKIDYVHRLMVFQ